MGCCFKAKCFSFIEAASKKIFEVILRKVQFVVSVDVTAIAVTVVSVDDGAFHIASVAAAVVVTNFDGTTVVVSVDGTVLLLLLLL